MRTIGLVLIATVAFIVALPASVPPSAFAKASADRQDKDKPKQEPNEAEELFKKMEEKLLKAKTVQLNITVIATGDLKAKLEAMVSLEKGNKAHLKFKVEEDGESEEWITVSDGKKLKVVAGVGRSRPAENTPKNFNDNILASLTRTGVFVPYLTIVTEETNYRKATRCSSFEMGKKRKVGEHDTQAITFSIDMKGYEGEMNATIWIDLETFTPLKSILIAKRRGKEMTFTEIHSNVKLNEEIDPKLFELPKEEEEKDK